MLLIEIYVVGAQSFQAGFERPPDVLGARALALTGHFESEFRGDGHFRASAAKETPNQLFATAVRVGIGGVEAIDTSIDRSIHDLSRSRFIDAHAEVVAADPDGRN